MKTIEYEYTQQYFVMPSDALLAFEHKIELYIINGNTIYRVEDIHTVVRNHTSLFTRKEKEIDYQAEFTLDTPWMVNDDGVHEYFAYALMYASKSNDRFRVFVDGCNAKDATAIEDWKFARHLTAGEEVKYLGRK